MITALSNFYNAHPATVALVSYYLASAFIGSLPAPTANASQFYLFLYKFLNTLGGNLSRAFASKVERSPNFQDALAKSGSAPVQGNNP